MISKELLEAVLGVEVTNVRDTMYDNELRFETPDEELRRKFSPYVPKINIYELGFKCKEWAFYTYKISVSSFKSGSFYLKEFNQIKDNSEYWVELDTASIDCEININDSGIFKSYSEPEAIFKACEWILKEINK